MSNPKMINVHDRVDKFLAYLLPAWYVVDFGAGDCYLASRRPANSTLSIDKVETVANIMKVDLDEERPDVVGDCAVLSGLLEWLDDPLSLLNWLFMNGRFPRVFFSYAMMKADPAWKYNCEPGQIVNLLLTLQCHIEIIPWQGQGLFLATKL